MRVPPVGKVISQIMRRDLTTGDSATPPASTPVTFYPEQVNAPRKVQIGAPLHVLREIREQLEDHLTSINQNTDEIHTNFEEINQLNQKVSKLSERLEELSMQLQMSALPRPAESFVVEPLTTREQEIFLVLYTEDDFVSQAEIARRLCLPETLVRQFLTSLMERGVSITRKGYGNDVLVKLDPGFKERQAKENIAGISEQLTLALATTGTLS